MFYWFSNNFDKINFFKSKNILVLSISCDLKLISRFFSKNIIIILTTYLASYTILRLIFLNITFKKHVDNKNEDSSTISYGKHLSLMNVIGTVATQIDKVLVFHYLGATQLAIYAIAIAVPEQIKGILKNVSSLALPKFAEKKPEEITKTLYKKMLQMFVLLLLIVISYWFLAPFIFNLFFPQYLDSVFYSRLFIFGLLNIPIKFKHIVQLNKYF